jgi:hypothetical protein
MFMNVPMVAATALDALIGSGLGMRTESNKGIGF